MREAAERADASAVGDRVIETMKVGEEASDAMAEAS